MDTAPTHADTADVPHAAAPASPPAIEVRRLTRRYGRRTIVHNLSFSVAPTQMLAVTGASGTGKSTVLNMLGLLEAPSDGLVLLQGSPAPRPRTRAATRTIRYQLGYLFQNYALIDHLTVRRNLEVALTYAPTEGRRSRAELMEEALTAVGLPGTQDRKVYTLSGGEQQRVAIARLLLKPCSVVLADEPTGSLDATNRDTVLGLLQDLRRRGKTIVVATHDEAVLSACTASIDLAPA